MISSSPRSPAIVRGKSAERGVALLVVIMVVLMVSFLASQLIMRVRAELRTTANEKSRTASLFLAEGGVNASLFWLLGDTPLTSDAGKEEKFLEGHVYTVKLPTGTIQYQAVNESGKIDLNSVPPQLLHLFLEYYGLDEKQIDIISDSLQDWRDADDMHRLNGAESEYYQKLPDPYVARNGNIQDPSEFFLIRGTDVLKGRLSPDEVFTVHNLGSKIDFNSLTPAMLDFLVGGDKDRRKAYYQAQELYGTLNEAMAMQILGDRFSLLRPYLSFGSPQHTPGRSSYYFIEATGRAGAGKGANPENKEDGQEKGDRPGIEVKALVKIVGSTVQVLSWKEEYV